jgi:hypothetical protein
VHFLTKRPGITSRWLRFRASVAPSRGVEDSAPATPGACSDIGKLFPVYSYATAGPFVGVAPGRCRCAGGPPETAAKIAYQPQPPFARRVQPLWNRRGRGWRRAAVGPSARSSTLMGGPRNVPDFMEDRRAALETLLRLAPSGKTNHLATRSWPTPRKEAHPMNDEKDDGIDR